MYQITYFIEKASNTFADNLTAFGLAYTLNTIADGRAQVRLEDRGFAFAVVCEPAIRQEWVENCAFFVGAPLLVTVDSAATKKQGKIVKTVKGPSLVSLPEPDGVIFLDYETEKQHRGDYFAWFKGLTPEQKKQFYKKELQPDTRPHPDWDIFRAVNPAALQSYNTPLGIWLETKKAFPELLKVLLAFTAQCPNSLEATEKAWAALIKTAGLEKAKDVTANQLLNPSQGKGTNHIKAEWRDPNNVKSFWLLEWLKTVGLFAGAHTRLVKNTKDRKTYVLCPTRLGWGEHQNVMKHFRELMPGSESAIKMDVLVALRYTQAFLKYYEGARATDPALDVFGEAPADLVSGMQMAFYKNLGNSPAVMNMASINLPTWVRPSSPENLAEFQTSLEEHIQIVRNLDESRGDQFNLMVRYRDFLSANDLGAFFDFTNAYSGFVMSQMERKKFVTLFSIPTLEVLFMNSKEPQFSEIMQNEGFRNIAYAIRHSTVTLQKSKPHHKPATDIRYGLGQQLARKAAYAADFLAELSEFLHLYNAENAQLREKNRNPFRKDVSTDDVEQVVALVDKFGSKVVCNMLVAFGYASDTRSKDALKEEDALVGEEPSGDDEETDSEE